MSKEINLDVKDVIIFDPDSLSSLYHYMIHITKIILTDNDAKFMQIDNHSRTLPDNLGVKWCGDAFFIMDWSTWGLDICDGEDFINFINSTEKDIVAELINGLIVLREKNIIRY